MMITQKYLDELTYRIIGCAIEVHRHLGPGLMETVYERCFIKELELRGLNYISQRIVPINYKGIHLDADLRFDVLVENLVVTELKAIACILPVHEAIVLTYMRMLEKPKGIIINFHCTNMYKEGQIIS